MAAAFLAAPDDGMKVPEASAQTAAPQARQLAPDNGAVVLMYHRFGEDSLPSTSVRLEQFEAHLQELTSGRYQIMALPDIENEWDEPYVMQQLHELAAEAFGAN